MQRRDLLPLLAGLGLAQTAYPASLRAQTGAARRLSIAFGDPVSSLDPQLNNFAGDRSVDVHFFDLLIENRDGGLQPALATAWRTLEPTLWEFTLRQGVTWHDGKPFTAEDVVYS